MMQFRTWGTFLLLGVFYMQWKRVEGEDPVDGHWSPWSVLGTPCTEECDGGTETKYRSCTNPQPQNGGLNCLLENDQTFNGIFEEREFPCNEMPCRTGQWSEWKECDNCTIGKRTRVSMCGEEECTGDQLVVDEEPCNNWNKEICPSPCEDLQPPCPEYGICEDLSTDTVIETKCVCTMGYEMDATGKNCMRPPPTPPPPRPIPTLAPAQKTVATVMSKTASVVLIIFVSITLAIFFLLRIFTPDRVIQMNMEIALLTAHVFLMFPPETYKVPILCKIVSICIHWCFTACYMFMMLEALHMYFLVAYVVKKDGAFSRIQNTLIGWGLSAMIVLFCICFEYENYGAQYHCWLQMDKPLVYGTFVPVIIIVIVTFTLIEAAGAANYKPLPDCDKKQRLSAKISQRTNLVILPFILAHWTVGMFSEYEQNLPLYGTFSVLNGITGFLVFFFHSTNNQQVRDKLKLCYKKMFKGGGST